MAHKVCEHSNYALSGLLRHPGITDRSQQPSAPATGTKPTPLDWVSASLVANDYRECIADALLTEEVPRGEEGQQGQGRGEEGGEEAQAGGGPSRRRVCHFHRKAAENAN
jgi:hypothetical protein